MTEETPIAETDARTLRFLKALVTILTATMILGLGAIVVMLMIRLQTPDPATPLPEAITLPSGATATAFTQGRTWYAVVTADNRILIFSRESGALIQEIAIDTQP